MKKRFVLFAVALLATGFSWAQVVMDADNLNGDFEEGWGPGDRAFGDTPSGVANWYNASTGDQTAICAKTNLVAAPASGYNGVLSDKNTGGSVLHSVKTETTIEPGNYFEISFDWLDAAGWEEGDKVRVAVVAYDNDSLTGTEVCRDWVQGLDADLGGDWVSVTGQTARASAAAWGRTLFIQVYGVNGGANSAGFARVDNIVVTRKDGLTIMDATTLNGFFDVNRDGDTGAKTFNVTPNWWNAGTGDQNATAINDNLSEAPASGYNAVCSDNGLGGGTLHSCNTGYTLQEGDRFDVSFDWRDAFGWEANDQARVALVAFDNNALSGTEVMRMTVSDKRTTATTWESVSETTAMIDAAAAGKTLFVQVYGINGGSGSGDFFRADNISVTLNPDTTPPSAPTLSLTAGDSNIYLELSVEADETFNVYRSTTSGSYGSPLVTNVAGTGYLDESVVNGTPYYYVVKAVDGLGRESGFSSEVSGIPLAYPLHSAKKGVGSTSRDKLLQKKRVEELNTDWYYSWSIDRNFNINSAIEYVPMRSSKFWPAFTNLANIGTFTSMLAWNEPYVVTDPAWEQVTVANAIDDGMYQDIVEAATNYGGSSVRIGSPSFVDPGNANAYWQDEFMLLAASSNLTVDFITCHSYPDPLHLAAGVKNMVDGLYAEYGKPIWVTEFNGGDWPDDTNTYTMAQTYTEMVELLYYLESTSYVERYAIFPFDDTYDAGNASQVFEVEIADGVTNATATLTPLGKLYAEYRSVDIGGPYADVWYYLHNKGSEQRLNHAATPGMTGISTEGADVCFKIVDAGAPNIYIVNRSSGERLSYNGSSLSWADPAVSDGTVQWKVVNGPDGWDYIFHPQSNKRLSGDSLSMVAWTTSDDTTQWAFVRAYPLAMDIDNDDLADDSEIEQFGSLATSEGGNDNYDSDLYTDAEELIAGTLATDSGSYFQMGLNSAGAGMLEVAFDGVAGRTYKLETTEDLAGGSWTVVKSIGPVSTNGVQVLHYDAPGDPANLFGRVRISLETP